jgi:hypothetical protein
VNVHDPLAMEVSATAAHAPVEIRGPGGATERRMPRMALDRGYGEVSFEATGSAGFYVLASLADRTPALCYAVNPPVEESDPSALPQETFVKRYGGLDAVWVARNQDVSETVRQTRTGVELWMSLLLTAALCLVAEQCLAARWAPRDA